MHRSFPDVFTEAEFAALLRESETAYGRARPIVVGDHRVSGTRLLSPSRFHYAPTGAELDACKTGSLTPLARAEFGAGLGPVTSSYNFYETGDHIGVHRDAPDCRYAALIPLTRDIGPLDTYPQLAGLDGPELLERVRADDLGAPVRVPLPYRGVVIIPGSVLPHARPAAARPCAVATVCFG